MKKIKTTFIITFLLASTVAFARPLIIAHRGGGQNWPENTLYAFEQALEAGADIIELDVQLTRDGIPVVYHPRDLSQWTDGRGPIHKRKLAYIKKMNAAWNYKVADNYPFRKLDLKIPTLIEVLQSIRGVPLIIDMKSLPAEQLVRALVRDIPYDEWKRLIFYSTNREHLDWIKKLKPDVTLFEERKQTRARLLGFVNSGRCEISSDARWLAFEWKRKMTVVEKFALGEDKDDVDFQLWSPQSIACVRRQAPHANIVLIGVNSKEDLQRAAQMHFDAVYTDSPKNLLSP